MAMEMTCARYSAGEELANSLTHGVGVLLSVMGTVALCIAASGAGSLAVASCVIFGSALIALYLASTLYHALPCPAAKQTFRVLDHSAIFVLIAGTYTPMSLIGLGGSLGWALLAMVWSLAVLGVVTTVIDMQRFKVLAMVLYVGMGWSVVVAAHRLLAALTTTEIVLLAAGGLCYTGGLGFYAWNRLPFNHAIWHGFVLAGSILHFATVMLIVNG